MLTCLVVVATIDGECSGGGGGGSCGFNDVVVGVDTRQGSLRENDAMPFIGYAVADDDPHGGARSSTLSSMPPFVTAWCSSATCGADAVPVAATTDTAEGAVLRGTVRGVASTSGTS